MAKLKNVIAQKDGPCNMCNKPIKKGDKISVLTVVEKIGTHKEYYAKVFHQGCMDEYLLARLDMGKPVSSDPDDVDNQ